MLPLRLDGLVVSFVLFAPCAAQERGTPLIGTGLKGWRDPGLWENVGSAVRARNDPRKLETRAGDGVLINGPGRTRNLLTVAEFGDIVAHIEFVVPKGSNSGVYFQGRYEVQILDSWGVVQPKFSDCGGIYQRWKGGKGFEGRPPRTNASRKPGEWQSFDVVFRAPRFDASGKKTENARFVSIALNGVVIHENVEVTGPTRAATFGDEKPVGPLMFQGDHGPVAYRNVRVRKARSRELQPRFWVPTATHVIETVEGFRLMVDPRLAARGDLYERTMRELKSQLYQITRKVPAKALARLRQVTIFVEDRSETRCMAYHPSRRWLTDHHHNPDLERCVELGNPQAFLSWTKAQPWMVLHELAHAYHHQFLNGGFGNPEVRKCFQAAKKAKTYESIQHINGREVRAYALTNHKEYFAEASEALFGTNDMYPFVRAELKTHDPAGYTTLHKLWNH
jgi:3-keto-disaccharide hydrolase